MYIPRIVIAALRGGSGKTLISLGLIVSWRKRGIRVASFKKGPDFIDAGWLARAANRPCHNLDTFLIPADEILPSFASRTQAADHSVIEGNRGLYDGIDLEGSTSTAELAKLLKAPVVLIVDCTKSTRTVAAMVLGCLRFDPQVDISGIVLNRVAGARHESILRKTVEAYCGVPVLGTIPKIKQEALPERHMGLVPTPEHPLVDESIATAGEVAEKYVDLDKILAIASGASPLAAVSARTDVRLEKEKEIPAYLPGPDRVFAPEASPNSCRPRADPFSTEGIKKKGEPIRIGVIRDAAFQFYYPENLEALEAAGAEILTMSALADPGLPDIDGLYIGGGFPETQAEALAENKTFRQTVRRLAEEGLPIYAECGGLMYLGESLVLEGIYYPMVGLLPVTFRFSKRPQAHGYTVFEVEKPNPYFKPGTQVRGHEFHYSKVLSWQGRLEDLAFRMLRGEGFTGKADGLCYKNVLATYSHIHALGTPRWAEALVNASVLYQKEKGLRHRA